MAIAYAKYKKEEFEANMEDELHIVFMEKVKRDGLQSLSS